MFNLNLTVYKLMSKYPIEGQGQSRKPCESRPRAEPLVQEGGNWHVPAQHGFQVAWMRPPTLSEHLYVTNTRSDKP